MSTNNTNVVGNLVGEPELRFTNTGRAVCNARIAVNERYQVNGEWKDRVTFLNLVAWEAQAENMSISLTKGDRVMVSGRIQIRSHTPEGSDKTNYYTEIVVQEIGVSLRWASVDSITKSTNADSLVSVGGGSDRNGDPIYGDDEPF